MGAEQSQLSDTVGGTGKVLDKTGVKFLINSVEYNVFMDNTERLGPESLLIDFIRDKAMLKGTKYMCREGGCGACTVAVTTRDPQTGNPVTRGVNACLMPLFGCDGWDIKTVEHLGSVLGDGKMHPIQRRMVDMSATQCGYCSPGWVMNMYGIMEGKKSMLAKDIEDCMDGNICRCTGYRPIMDAMKSLAVDASEELKRKCSDLENCSTQPFRPSKCQNENTKRFHEIILEGDSEVEEIGSKKDFLNLEPTPLHLTFKSGEEWVKATDLDNLFLAIQRFQSRGLIYQIVAGNTARGVYKNPGPYQGYVEVNSIALLKRETVDPSLLVLGGGVTINTAIECLKKAGSMDDYGYCKDIAKHWQRVANNAVRNAGTLAGNLMVKHEHREFPSDIFIVLEAIGATIVLALDPVSKQMKTVEEFMNTNMSGKILLAIQFPKLKGWNYRSFKISRRFQNAHAYVNAGFLVETEPGKFVVKSKPRIVFGGISPTFVHAAGTETFLVGKSLLEEKDIQGAMVVLDKELKPEVKPPEADPVYLKSLAQSLLYKCILGIVGDSAKPKLRSGGTEIVRGLSYGKQTYDTDKKEWPIYQPIPKIEAPIQCTGEAEYVNDIGTVARELAAAFVLAKVGNAELSLVDPTDALQVPGVITYVGARDIPGVNNYMSTHAFPVEAEVIFVENKILFAGQPIGVVIAETREIALKAAPLVKIKYTNVKPPILDIPTALEKARLEGTLDTCTIKVVKSEWKPEANVEAAHKISGEFLVGGQYHMYMEPQVVLCVPKEDGMDVYGSTQWVTHMQSTVADCLGLPANLVNVESKRVGGAFGGKLARTSMVAAACAVAAHKLKRPVRFAVDMESMMCALGKRHPYLFKYAVEFDDTGKISSLNIPFFCNSGGTVNEPTSVMAFLCMQSCYHSNGWQLAPGQVSTNIAPNTYCRAPGSTQGIGCIEYIMDHIAFILKKDPMDVRLVNLIQKGDPIFSVPGEVLKEDNKVPTLFEQMKGTADLEERKKFVKNFNENNRWMKRALAVVPMNYAVHFFFSGYNIYISIYPKDGTVGVCHAGIEMGQGINTKVVQVVARQLRIPVSKIKVKPPNSLVSPGSAMTAAAVTSEHICYSALKACEILNARLAPIREKLGQPTWEVLVAESHLAGIDLTASYITTVNDKLVNYNSWGMTACEVEVDILTGEYKIVRVDLINDSGISLSPEVDVGQVEGAFVMGLGLWLTEKLQFDKNTGELITNRTWDYKPPLSKDIPEDFRVTFLPNAPNPYGVLRSKATGESPLCMAVVAFLAIKQAIAAARSDAGNTEWFQMSAPATPENIQQLCLTTPTQFTV